MGTASRLLRSTASIPFLVLLSLPLAGAAQPADADGDEVPDSRDNCIAHANPDQRDTDGDGFGNRCDGDFNGDGLTNFGDLAVMRQTFFGQDPDTDLDGSGFVNFADLAILKQLFFSPPGPAAEGCVLPEAGIPRESSRFRASVPAMNLRNALAVLQRDDPEATVGFFLCEVDGFSTTPKETIPDYAIPVLADLDLDRTPRKPALVDPPTLGDKYAQDLDSEALSAHAIPVASDEPLGPNPTPDPEEGDRVEDDPGGGVRPVVQRRTEPPIFLEPLPEPFEPPDDELVQREGRAAKRVLTGFLQLHPDVFRLPREELAQGLPSLEQVEYRVGRFFRRAVYEQKAGDVALLDSRTLVLFDANWNVMQISRMLVTPEKLRLDRTEGVSEQEAVDTAKRTAATLSGVPVARWETASAVFGADAVRRLTAWQVRVSVPDAPEHDFTVLVHGATGGVLSASDNIDAFTDARLRRWAYSSGDLTGAFQVISESQYTRDDNTLTHDFFYTVTDERGGGDGGQVTCTQTPVNSLWRSAAYGANDKGTFIRHTHRSDRDFSLWSPAAASGTFQESHAYYWSRWFYQWNKPAFQRLGALPSSFSDWPRTQIIHNACIDDIGYANSDFKVTIQHNEGESAGKVRLRDGCRSGNPNCSSGDYADGSSSSFSTCEGQGCHPTPSVIHHEINHRILGGFFGIGSSLDCGGGNQLKFLHEGAMGSVVPQAYWHHYYGVGYNPPDARLFTKAFVRGRVHSSPGTLLRLGDYLCVDNLTGQGPYEAGRVAGQALWKFYHGRYVVGSSITSTPRPTTDTDWLTLVYWASDLVAASTYKDRYEIANRVMQVVLSYFDYPNQTVKNELRSEWCDTWDQHQLDNYIHPDYCP